MLPILFNLAKTFSLSAGKSLFFSVLYTVKTKPITSFTIAALSRLNVWHKPVSIVGSIFSSAQNPGPVSLFDLLPGTVDSAVAFAKANPQVCVVVTSVGAVFLYSRRGVFLEAFLDTAADCTVIGEEIAVNFINKKNQKHIDNSKEDYINAENSLSLATPE
jgi:hypothetical protein